MMNGWIVSVPWQWLLTLVSLCLSWVRVLACIHGPGSGWWSWRGGEGKQFYQDQKKIQWEVENSPLVELVGMWLRPRLFSSHQYLSQRQVMRSLQLLGHIHLLQFLEAMCEAVAAWAVSTCAYLYIHVQGNWRLEH